MDAKFPHKGNRARDCAFFFVIAVIAYLAFPAQAQEVCVKPDRINELKAAFLSQKPEAQNQTLKTEILQMKSDLATFSTPQSQDKSASPSPEQTHEAVERMCAILRSEPWPSKTTVGEDGASTWIRLVKTYFSPQLQVALLPVISAGVEKDQIKKDGELASLIDRLRLKAGMPQLFGTQAVANNNFIVISPLYSAEQVDTLRAEYGIAPLRDYIRALQSSYQMPVIWSPIKPAHVAIKAETAKPENGSGLLQMGNDDNDVVTVNTSLVTINVTVFGQNVPDLTKSDFKIFEDGQPQEISVFSSPTSPFDIILLLDLSGSTAEKLGLIKKTTKNFIEMKRNDDRLGIVTFSDKQTVVSPLESDKEKLFDSVSKIKDFGGSWVWDAEKFALDMLQRDSKPDRRKAVVVMTDGNDNALTYEPGAGSKTLFADLVEEVRNNSIAIFPIYLDTQGPGELNARMYADARRTLQLLANESGGNYYTTKDIGKLSEVYERVLRDVGRVYSLGYEPTNAKRDGSWRTIRVEIPGHPEIKVRARPGYYAK